MTENLISFGFPALRIYFCCIQWSEIRADSCLNHTNIRLYVCFELANRIYIDWSRFALCELVCFTTGRFMLYGRWGYYINDSINTSNVNFFLWSWYQNNFGMVSCFFFLSVRLVKAVWPVLSGSQELLKTAMSMATLVTVSIHILWQFIEC